MKSLLSSKVFEICPFRIDQLHHCRVQIVLMSYFVRKNVAMLQFTRIIGLNAVYWKQFGVRAHRLIVKWQCVWYHKDHFHIIKV